MTPHIQAPAEWYSAAGHLADLARKKWRSVAMFGILGALVAAAASLLLPSYYRSGAAFQAETAAPLPLSGALAGLAAQVGGLQLGAQSSPQLFGDLLTTDAVLRHIASVRFIWNVDTLPLSAIYGYQSGNLEKRIYDTVKRLRKSISVDVNLRTGVVRFSVEARSPELAEALADSLLTALNEANVALRQTRASAERTFTSGRAAQARDELTAAEHDLSDFYARNRVITGSPALQMQEARLRRAVDMSQQVYVQLRLQEEQAAVQAVRNTPAISVIDPPVTPVKRSRPKRQLAVLLGLMTGILVGFAEAALQTRPIGPR